VIPGTPYLHGEIDDSGEKTRAAYLMLNFGSKDPIVAMSGSMDIGVRYVQTETGGGSVQFRPTRSRKLRADLPGRRRLPLRRGRGLLQQSRGISAMRARFLRRRSHVRNWLPSFT